MNAMPLMPLMPVLKRLPCLRGAFALIAAGLVIASPLRAAEPPVTESSPAAVKQSADDPARKAEIMSSPQWRRAIFELGEWLSAQQIYSPQQVNRIKADFNRRVAGMSSYELEYLLEDLDAKFKIMETPEAKDAKAWIGQYMAVMSDQKRAEVLKDVPDMVTMTSAQLQQEIDRIEQKKVALQRQQQAFDQSRDLLVQQAAANRQQTAAAAAAAMAQTRSAAFSPYHGGGGGGKPPFSDVKGSGMRVTAGPFGAYVSFNAGAF